MSGLPVWASYIIIVVLVCFSGLFSGLTLGLLGLDPTGLEIIANAGSPRDSECAKKIIPVRASGNLLLCTLLLGNVAVNAALSVLMADLTSGLVGFFVSTAVIVIFGEIVPQSTCSRYALQIGAFACPIVKLLMCLMYVIAKPLAVVLDLMLGAELGTVHSKQELVELMRMQREAGVFSEGAERIVHGALAAWDKRIEEVMTPISDTYMLEARRKLDHNLITEVHETGFSRVPVYNEGRQVIGMLLSKDLLLAEPEDLTPLEVFVKVFDRPVVKIKSDTTLGEAMKIFQESRTHLAMVCYAVREEKTGFTLADKKRSSVAAGSLHDEPITLDNLLGVISHEDCLEAITQNTIFDETDRARSISPELRQMSDLHATHQRRSNCDWGGSKVPAANFAGSKRLLESEVASLSVHLRKCAGSIVDMPSESELEQTLREAPVLTLAKYGDFGAEPVSEDYLFQLGEPMHRCLVVLSGRVQVITGRDQFRFEVGTFGLLGVNALAKPEATADFSAFIAGKIVRVLQLQREDLTGASQTYASFKTLGASNTLNNMMLQNSTAKGRPSRQLEVPKKAPVIDSGKASKPAGKRPKTKQDGKKPSGVKELE